MDPCAHALLLALLIGKLELSDVAQQYDVPARHLLGALYSWEVTGAITHVRSRRRMTYRLIA